MCTNCLKPRGHREIGGGTNVMGTSTETLSRLTGSDWSREYGVRRDALVRREGGFLFNGLCTLNDRPRDLGDERVVLLADVLRELGVKMDCRLYRDADWESHGCKSLAACLSAMAGSPWKLEPAQSVQERLNKLQPLVGS
jgi:hypothetical protein